MRWFLSVSPTLLIIFASFQTGLTWYISSISKSFISHRQFATSDSDALRDDPGEERRMGSYNLGIGRNQPIVSDGIIAANDESMIDETSASRTLEENHDRAKHWVSLESVSKPPKKKEIKREEDQLRPSSSFSVGSNKKGRSITRKKILPSSEETKHLKAAVWDEHHYEKEDEKIDSNSDSSLKYFERGISANAPSVPKIIYPYIDLSIPNSVYCKSDNIDVVWETLRYEAFREAEREPLLVSFFAFYNFKS